MQGLLTATMPKRPQPEPQTPFARRLRQLRRERGLSQGAFGKAVGLSQAMISALEIGNSLPTRETFDLLIERYSLDRQEWEQLAEFSRPLTDEERLAEAARRGAQEALREARAEYMTGGLLTDALLELANKTGKPVLIDPSLAALPRSTPADIEAILARVRKDMGLE